MTVDITAPLPAQQLADAQARIAELERALAQANETQTLFRIMVDAIPTRVFWKDVNLTYLGANRKFAEDAGLTSPEQMIGKSDYELSWRDQADLYRADDSAVIASGVAKINFEEPQTTPDGGRIWLETSKVPLRNAAGETIGVMGTYSDITPRKRDQQALIESEAKAKALIEAFPDPVTLANRDGVILEYHAREDSSLYAPTAMVVGQNIINLVPPEVAARTIEKIGQVLDTGIAQTMDYSMMVPTGEVHIETRIARASAETVITITRDVSDKKKAEEEIRRLASIIENTSDFVGVADASGRSIYLNTAGQAMIGLPPGADSGAAPREIKIMEFIAPAYRDLIGGTAIPMAMRNGAHTLEFTLISASGHEIPVSGTIVAQSNPDGSPASISLLARDISEQKRAEAERTRLIEELQIANRIARESSRAKSEFLATMSHELRTPLNAIIGFSDMLLLGMSGPLNEKQAHKMERLKENSRRLLALINDLLDLTRIEAGRVEIAQKQFAPKTLVERLAAQIESLAHESKLEFTTQVGPDVPPLLIGDEKRIEQIILNLLSNAFKFTEKGSVSLALDANETHWTLAVSDTGIGIPPHAQNLIFEAFRQVDGSFSRAYQGSGLGLSIARDLVRMMDGKITLKSAVGVGSTFTVILPINTPASEAQPVLEPARS